MKDEQTRAAIVQWLVPTIVLIVVVIVMLFNFSAKSNQAAAEDVENDIISVAEKYAAKVNHKLMKMAEAGKPVGWLMVKHASLDSKTAEMAEALCRNTEAYAVVFCDEDGNAICQDGSEVRASELSYYPEVVKDIKDTDSDKALEEFEVRYIYVSDDELGNGNEAIISIISFYGEEGTYRLLLFYPPEDLAGVFKKTEFDAAAFYAMINLEGEIIVKAGADSNFLKEENLWTTVKQDSSYNDSVMKATIRMKNRTAGSFNVSVNGEARRLVYVPAGINNWILTIGINQNYVERIQSREWRNTKQMIYQLVVAVWVFLGLVVVMNIINKIKSSEKGKELEEKADTDMLTSLNNKLATERKIKEYMLNHPNDQALMFVLDIDNFKKINDTLGHAFGDEVLRSLGHQIGVIFRATDVIGRTGGDEFTIFLKHLSEDALLEKEAKKLCTFFKNFQAGEYVKYAATASIGAAVYPRDGKDFESLYKAADNALYMAKKRGKSQLAFYGDEDEKSEGKKKVEEESRLSKLCAEQETL